MCQILNSEFCGLGIVVYIGEGFVSSPFCSYFFSYLTATHLFFSECEMN